METSTNNNGNTLSWASLNLNEVTPESTGERTETPAGNYTFRLVNAKPSPYQAGATDIDFVITEGPQARRHVFASLPTPDKGKWVISAASLLIKSLGGEHKSGEELVDTLNRIAANGGNKITADIVDNQYVDKNTQEVKQGRPRFQYFSVMPAV